MSRGADLLRQGVALAVLIGFAVLVVYNRDHLDRIPAPLYPLPTLALGYFVGFGILKKNGNGK